MLMLPRRAAAASSGRRRERWTICATLLALALGASACVVVKPWEKDRLAKKSMTLGKESLENKFVEHRRAARQGAFGNRDSAAGGCGCN